MDMDENLRRIYKEPDDRAVLGKSDRLLRLAKQLTMHKVSRQMVEQCLRENKPIRCTNQPEGNTCETVHTWFKLILNGRTIFQTCRQSPAKTRARGTCLP